MRKLLSIFLVLALAGCSGQQVLNTMTSERGYDLATNFIYDDANNLRLDIYTPQGARNAPVIVFFYGGRWSRGIKEDYKFVGQALAAQGYVAVIPDYREYPRVRFPEFVKDGARAVKWTREHITQYGGAPGRLFLMGHQSGAHIAALLALNEQYLKEVGGSRSWLRGMIGLSGPYDFMPITDPTLRDLFAPPETFEQTQPIIFADSSAPPLLLMHGEDDEIVDVKNTRSLAGAIAKSGGTVETVIYPKMSNDNMIRALGPVLRQRYDVLANIDQFIRRWINTTPQQESGIQTTPLQP